MEAVKAEILLTTWEKGQVSAGTIGVVAGNLVPTVANGYEELMRNITEVFEEDFGGKNPQKFILSLPEKYTGATLRARLVGGR